MNKDNCNQAVEVIVENCGDVTADYLEYGIDAFLDEGIIKDIPIVKTVYALIKTPISLWNAYNMQKLIYFCYYMKDTPSSDRAKFVNKAIYKDKHFGQKLLLTINKIDDLDKMQMLKNIFLAYGNDHGIDYDTFRRLCICLEKTYVQDLKYLQQCIESGNKYFHGEKMINLSNAGLAVMAIYGRDLLNDDIFVITPLGRTFYECVFTDKYALVV